MQPARPIETDIVLLGAGHAHLEVLRRFALRPEPGVRLTLLSREPETLYSGMLPGLVRGDYTDPQVHVDLAPLSAFAQAVLVVAEATAIDLLANVVTIPGRADIGFDLLSIDVGGETVVPPGAGLGVKPIGTFVQGLRRLEAALEADARIAVVGGGPAGAELVLSLAARFAGRFRLLLISATDDPIASAPELARRAVRRALVEAGVELVCGMTAAGLQDGRLALSDGSFIDVAAALWATGVAGPGLLAASGLACDAAGCVRVGTDLRSVSHDKVFAAGDCSTMEGNKRPKAGVWAVRAGMLLADNLRRAAQSRSLDSWRPQRNALVILGLGGGKAVAWRNGIAIQGHKAWWLKDRIDRRWMRTYSDLRTERPADSPPRREAGSAAPMEARPGSDHPAPLPALDTAAVIQPPVGKVMVQSVSHLPAIVDDPFVLGQIAAAHALSDLYARGVVPWTALAIGCVPYAAGGKMQATWAAMLQGARDILHADGCDLIGGHRAEAAAMALGFAVTGLADHGKVLQKAGLQAGDQLILTKKLGTGIVLAGHARGQTRVHWLLATIESMRTTNSAAARIALAHRLHAVTAIADRGLAGHLCAMLHTSEIAAVLWPETIPMLPGAQALASHGVASRMAVANQGVLGPAGATPDTALLVDPQTSGGLLFGLPPDRAEICLQALLDADVEAAMIGEITPMQPGIGIITLK